MVVTVRDRDASDLDACVEVLRAVHELDAYPMNWPEDPPGWLAPPGLARAWVAEGPHGAVAGHVAVLADGELSRLFVAPAARHGSVGTALVGRARDWAAEQGRTLRLVVVDEAAAVAFYRATGWRSGGTSAADWTGPDGRPVRLHHFSR